MKLLVNKNVKALFIKILMCVLAFAIVSAILFCFPSENTAVYILIGAFCMVAVILSACYGYFVRQDAIIDHAASQIAEYISGNHNVRIACNEEGSVYRLFHEINSLAAILSAQVENESKTKDFLRNTISDISHQLKTPLAALNIYNGIIQGEAEEASTIKEFTELSEQELDRLETLVQSLLKIAKFDAGTIVIDKKPENVSDMMEHVKKHFSYRAAQEEKEISLSGDDDITLLCDQNWFLEAVDNIVKNALDHTKKGGTVRIVWKQFPSVVQIMVQDNGCGIHPEDLYHIFKRFYRSRFSKDVQGIGLGLPLAKAIIEAHNGTIEVDSEPGVGTSFIINLLTTELF